MPGFYDVLKGEPEDSYGIPIDAYIKYQRDHIDRVEHTNEDEMEVADQLTQLSQELGMYDTQLDENKRVELEEMIATKLLEVVSQEDLENTYYEMQKEWAESMQDDELLQTARELKIVFDDTDNIV